MFDLTNKVKSKKKYIVLNILMLAFLFLSISFNKEYLRPLYGHIYFIGILLGSYPNFIASYIISLFILKIALNKNIRFRRYIFYSFSFIVFVSLTVEELKPLWGVSKTFDLFDILANGLGCALAIITYEFIAYKQKDSIDLK